MNLTSSIKDKYEVNKTVMFSTDHLSQYALDAINCHLADEEYFDWVNQLSCYLKADFGFFIVVSDAELVEGTPKEVVDILTIGQQLGCYYVEFDCDGPVYDHLPTFDHSAVDMPFDVTLMDMRTSVPVGYYNSLDRVIVNIDVETPNEEE